MNKLLTALTLLSVGAAASVTAQDADPVGDWEWVVDVDGQSFSGTMEITGAPGEYAGSMSSDMGVADITVIVVDGNLVTLELDTGQGLVNMEIEITGDEFEGVGAMDGFEFSIFGTRITG